ncbi:unnamed protein product [Candidula unifasciata]|uniref:FAM65 N-terminal domain-containing protein n=1 Tax=Candidula unifasciata TaxID=100452 RepID=A0A8S3YD70_9EUPU|nr:unnamed protein product [Candidula unifasciata]
MTRILYTPNHGGDNRLLYSISQGSKSNSIPSLDTCYNINTSSPTTTTTSNNNSKGVLNHNHLYHHHYLQNQQHHFSSSSSNIMSLRDTPGRGGAPVSRSHSFGGVSIASNMSSTSTTPSVLGETIKRSARIYTKPQSGSRSFRKSPKIPKVPRPSKALMVFDCVKRGIGEFIQATHEDIAQLMASESATSTAQGRLHETDKQIKAAERYLKRLEFHLAKIDELHDCYLLNQQLREGARNMARAYSATSSQSRKDSLANVKYGYKECSQTMCAIEAQLENMLGTFSCRLKGMAGFARLVPGDVFEVVIKHGGQKWKTKGRIEKNNTQRWDSPEYTFKCLVGETLNIKASEVRAFKSVQLGQKNCEVCQPSTHDTSSQGLFSAFPQLMTVSINVHGSLKLSIIITWNPLDGMDEAVTYFEPPARPSGSASRRRPMSMIATNGSLFGSNSDLSSGSERKFPSPMQSLKQRDDSGIYGSATSLPSHTTQDSRQSHSLSASPIMHGHRDPSWTPDLHSNRLRPHSPEGVASSSSSSSSVFTSSSLSGPVPEVTQSMVPGVVVQAEMVSHDATVSVEEALGSLTTTLEDFLGHYPELQKLEEMVQVIESLVRKKSARGSRSSSMSVSIEGAIEEAFDFLNTEDGLDDLDEEDENEEEENLDSSKMTPQVSNIDKFIMSPESTAKTSDSGIESLAKRLQEDTHLGSSVGSSPVPPSSGNEQVDQALVFHLTYCDKLLENLGNYGPLKCREFYALDHLQKQAQVLEKLVEIAKAGTEVDLHAVLAAETPDKALRELWMLCVDQTPLYVHPEKIIHVMEQKFGANLSEHHGVKSSRVFCQLMARVLDVPSYIPELGHTSIVTLHQFMLYFQDGSGLTKLDRMAEELCLLDRLNANSSDIVIKAILTLREDLPPPACLKMLTKLLVGNTRETQQSATSYLKIISRDKAQRDKAMVVLVEGLEDHIAEVRAGCCVALTIIEAEESIEQLVHVCQSDSSSTVRRKAKEALYSFGEVGRQAFEEAQLSSQGFQGLQVRKL